MDKEVIALLKGLLEQAEKPKRKAPTHAIRTNASIDKDLQAFKDSTNEHISTFHIRIESLHQELKSLESAITNQEAALTDLVKWARGRGYGTPEGRMNVIKDFKDLNK
jgi:hypothetical protein